MSAPADTHADRDRRAGTGHQVAAGTGRPAGTTDDTGGPWHPDGARPPAGLADRLGAPGLAGRLLSCWRVLAASSESGAARLAPRDDPGPPTTLAGTAPDGRPPDALPPDALPPDGLRRPDAPPGVLLAFASADPAGTARLVLDGWRPPPGDATDHRAAAGRLARRVDRAAALAVPWSRYDEALQLLLASAGPDSGTPRLTLSLRLGPPGRPAALRIHSPNPGPALGPPPDFDAVGVPAGLSLRLTANRPGGLRWYHTGTGDGLSELDTLAHRYRVPDVTAIRRFLALLPPAGSGDAVLWWLQPEPGWFGAIVDGARLDALPGAGARLDRLLHTLRHHLVGYRAASGLIAEIPHRVGIAVPAGPAAADVPPVLSIAGPPRYAPPGTAAAPVSGGDPRARAARRAIRFLLDAQSPGGGWWDLAVNAGSSGPWLTAVVGLALAGAAAGRAGAAAQAGVRPALRRAGQYLHGARRPDGWGWNEALEPDCDSTAHAILLLHRLSENVDAAAVRALLSFQTADGAFRTYRDAPPGHSWGEVHHDVHPAALRALHALAGRGRTAALRSAIDAGLPVLAAGARLDPPWPAFWWTTTGYGAYVSLLCLSELHRMDLLSTVDRGRVAATVRPGSALQTALSASVALLTGEAPAAPLLDLLCATQRADGSWDTEPALRVVEAGCAQPWRPELAAVAGTVYPETARVFTAAMALSAFTLAASR